MLPFPPISMLNRHTDFDFDLLFASACTDSNIEIGGGGTKEKTWFKSSGVLYIITM